MIVFFIGFFCGFLFSIIILSLLFSAADPRSPFPRYEVIAKRYP